MPRPNFRPPDFHSNFEVLTTITTPGELHALRRSVDFDLNFDGFTLIAVDLSYLIVIGLQNDLHD